MNHAHHLSYSSFVLTLTPLLLSNLFLSLSLSSSSCIYSYILYILYLLHTKYTIATLLLLLISGVEDGISFLCEDLDLWRDVEGAVEWVQKFATEANGVEVPPQVAEEDEEEEAPELVQVGDKDTSKDTDKRKQEEEEEEGLEGEEEFDDEMAGFHNLTAQEKHQMYVGMFYTGVEMAGLLSTEEE